MRILGGGWAEVIDDSAEVGRRFGGDECDDSAMRCQKSVPALRERAVKNSGEPQKLAVKNFKVKVEKKLKIQNASF